MLVVVAPTYYPTVDDIRYQLGIESCRQAAKYEISLLLVDASPSPEVARGLETSGRTNDGRSFVRVVPQTWNGRKGVALREGIHIANTNLQDQKQQSNSDEITVIAFQELEKVGMWSHYKVLMHQMIQSNAQIVVPRRSDESFKRTYPIEQYHSENFANLLLDSLGHDIDMPSIDWTIGPVLFRSEFAHYWLDYDGETWDAQLVPIVDAHIKGAKVTSMEIEYDHPKQMKEQEEGIARWNEKRLHQINVLTETVGKRLKDGAKTRHEQMK